MEVSASGTSTLLARGPWYGRRYRGICYAWRVARWSLLRPRVCSAIGCSPVNYDGTIKTLRPRARRPIERTAQEQFKLKVLQLELRPKAQGEANEINSLPYYVARKFLKVEIHHVNRIIAVSTRRHKSQAIIHSIHLLIFLEQCDLLPVTGEHQFLGI